MRIIALTWIVWILSRHRLQTYVALATVKSPDPTTVEVPETPKYNGPR